MTALWTALMPDWSRAQWWLRMMIVLGTVAALVATGPAGQWPSPVLVGVVAFFAVGGAVAPESAALVVAFVVVLAWWVLGPTDPEHPAVMLAAAGLLLAQVAAMLAASGPGWSVSSRGLLRRWLLRSGVVYLPVPVVYALVLAVRDVPEPPYVWVVAVAAVGVALLAAGALYPNPTR